MNLQNPIHSQSGEIPVWYRLMRAVVRTGLWLFFPRLRVLNQERLEQPGSAILLISRPRSFSAALLLLSALDRQVYCLLPSGNVRGFFRKLAARALGMKTFNFMPEEQDSWLDPCLDLLANQKAIALFAGKTPETGTRCAPIADFAARLTVEAILQGQEQLQPVVYPLHWFLGTGRRGPNPLVFVDRPIQVLDFLPKVGEDLTVASQNLVEAIQNAIGSNIFGLAEPDLERFIQELEDLSREDLRQQWSQRQDWKQKPEDLQLSSFARKWIAEHNLTNPARLVELRESLTRYREAHRQCSMEGFIAETAGDWQFSSTKVKAAWVETVIGFPVTLYGLFNHLPAIIILWVSGLLKSSPKRDPKVEWLFRIFIVLSSYTAQVFLVHFWWGRAAAGYYTLTLPVSGAYLWRYHWMVRHRIHVLFRKVLQPGRVERVARERENILAGFERELQCSMRSPGTPNPSSAEFAE